MIELFRSTALIVVSLLVIVVGLKVIWNLFLPYGMIRLKEGQGVSTFPLIEFIPFVIAVLIAWAAGLTGWFSPKSISVKGFALIALSYVHFIVVLMVVGYARSKRKD